MAAKQSRNRRAPYALWIGASPFGLLAMTATAPLNAPCSKRVFPRKPTDGCGEGGRRFITKGTKGPPKVGAWCPSRPLWWMIVRWRNLCLVVQMLHSAPRPSSGQAAGIDPKRKFVASRRMTGIDVKRSSRIAAVVASRRCLFKDWQRIAIPVRQTQPQASPPQSRSPPSSSEA